MTNANDLLEHLAATDKGEIEFVDELPKISRSVESGVWVERLAPLRERPDSWAKVYGPTPSPHAVANNVRSGNAAGIDPDEWDFTARMFDDPNGAVDDEGNAVKIGYVFARFMSEDTKAEVLAARAERAAKRAASLEDADDLTDEDSADNE